MENNLNPKFSKIYKIINSAGLCYIGSTTQKYLSRRLSCHKYHYERWKKGKMNFMTSFKVIAEGDYKIELVEEVKDNNLLLTRERFYIENTNCVNKIKPTRTQKEYVEANKEKINNKIKNYFRTEYKKQDSNYKKYKDNYYLANKDEINFNNRMKRRTNKFNNLINQLETFIKQNK